MGRYFLRRAGQAVVVLWAAYTVSFFILVYLPGDAVTALAGAGGAAAAIDPRQLDALKADYGLDQPVLVQYADRLLAAVRGDFGTSFATGQPVSSTLARALPPTVQLTVTALVLAVVAAVALAVLATWRSGGWLRQLLVALPPLATAVPAFWTGLMLIQLLSFRAGLFPAFGDGGVRGLVLPAVTLAIPSAAMLAQVLTKSLETTLDEPYIDVVRAKGAGPSRVRLRHALRNAALPALTVAGVLAGGLLANSVLIETVFSRDGLGRVIVSAVAVQDIPVVQGVVVFSAAVFVGVNLLVDLAYPLVDPRIVMDGRGSGA